MEVQNCATLKRFRGQAVYSYVLRVLYQPQVSLSFPMYYSEFIAETNSRPVVKFQNKGIKLIKAADRLL
jgi:hypothetical protein